MTKQETSKAVIYVRVSTDEQAEDALNLINQETRCRKYCEQKGLTVAKVFTDAGESARSSDRPQFQNMLAYCRKYRNEVGFVVVQDLSRFARNHKDQAESIWDLERSGVRLRSTYENNIDETAAGKLAANIFGAFNQFFSDSHSEKQKDRKRLAVMGGRVPWKAPIGYTNIRAKDGANIAQDQERAPFIRKAFELIAAGKKKREALNILNDEGFTAASGKPVTSQTFDKILKNPIYAGWVTLSSDAALDPVRGLHEAIVNQELFDTVQAILAGKKVLAPRRCKINPDFPLRRMVRCRDCGTPLTGANCRGRGGRYPRYWCRQPGCRAVSIPKAHLESEFQKFLGWVKPKKHEMADFPKIAARIWDAKQGNAQRESKKLTANLEEQKKLKGNLLTLRMEGEISKEEFEEANAAFRVKIHTIEEKLQSAALTKAQTESFVRFAELQVMDLAQVWRIASPEQRERVQNLLFEGGLDYSPKNGFLNRSKCSLFYALETVDFRKDDLVEAAGVEPASERAYNREHSCFFRSFGLISDA